MTPMKKTEVSRAQLFRLTVLAIVFLSLTCMLYLIFSTNDVLTNSLQKVCYSLGMSSLMAGMVTLLLAEQGSEPKHEAKPWWFYPLVSALLALGCMSLAYMYLGIWPIGERSCMIVDMHHQYAPLLAQLRSMLLHGGSALYTFKTGLGSNFVPMFAYYLASPFNLLLVLFPERYLPEGILVITLLKNALTAGFFALCLQYVYRRRDKLVIIVSIMYSMMMYLLAYSWDIMWLDCIMILPLVVMSFEKLMHSGKYLPYVLTLAYALYTNYYIGFMVCLFMVLYFLCYMARYEHPLEERRRGFGRFVIGSVLGGGLVMFLLIPVYVSLGNTSAAGGSLPDIAANFKIFDLLGRHLFETSPTIRSGNLPNIYCGVLAFFLLPIYATMKTIPLRRRLAYLGLYGIMAASLVINQFNLIWHGLHTPNDLPYRFSFLYSFVLLLIAYEVLMHLRDISTKQIGGSVAGVILYLILLERIGDDKYSFTSIYASLLLVLIYAGIIMLASHRRIALRSAYSLLLFVVVTEMTLNAGVTFKTMQTNEYFTAHSDYVDNDTASALYKAVAFTKGFGNTNAHGSFYRMEFLPRRTTDDDALYNYHGLTVFASSNPLNLTKFMGYLGYAINGVNSYQYNSFVPAADSLLGLKYLILSSNITSHPQLTQVKSVPSGSQTEYIYENKAALPLGFLVNSAVKGWTPASYNPIVSQNSLYSSMTGQNVELYTYAKLSVGENSLSSANLVGDYGFSMNTSDGSASSFTATVAKAGQAYVYVDCTAAKSITISAGDNSWTASPNEPYIIDAGTLSANATVTVTLTADGACTGNIYVCTLNQDVFSSQIQTLAANPLKVTSYSDTKIKGSITASKSGTVFTSIPYDKGWTVKVDGKKVKASAIGEALLAFDVTAGTHTVEISFFTPGLIPGVLISLTSLAALVLLLVFIGKKVNPRNPYDNEFRALQRFLKEQPEVPAGVDGVRLTADGFEPEGAVPPAAYGETLPDTGNEAQGSGGEAENSDNNPDAGL